MYVHVSLPHLPSPTGPTLDHVQPIDAPYAQYSLDGCKNPRASLAAQDDTRSLHVTLPLLVCICLLVLDYPLSHLAESAASFPHPGRTLQSISRYSFGPLARRVR